jgi:hypothetical protein
MKSKRPLLVTVLLSVGLFVCEILGTMVDTFVHGSTNAKREEQERYWRWRRKQQR